MKLVYFAWVRERIGLRGEEIETTAPDVAALLDELAARDERYQLALGDRQAIRVALDQELAALDAPLAGVGEVAIFPPMTGG